MLGVTGAAALRIVRSKKEWALALFPVIFAVQQGIEGALWLLAGKGSSGFWEEALARLYLFFAYFLWPFFTPAGIYWIEPKAQNRKKILPFWILGAATAFYLSYFMVKDPVRVHVVCNSLYYETTVIGHDWVLGFYLIAVCVPFLLSSYKPLNIASIVVMSSCGVSYYFYRTAFDSIWCFYAALLSAGIYFFLRWLRKNE